MWFLHEHSMLNVQPTNEHQGSGGAAGGGGGNAVPGGSVLEGEAGFVLETEDGKTIKL